MLKNAQRIGKQQSSSDYLLLVIALVVTLLLGDCLLVGVPLVKAASGVPAPHDTCDSHCYGIWEWNGTTLGAKTLMSVVNLTCPPSTCYQGSSNPLYNYFIDDELWLRDTSDSAWVEVGVSTFTDDANHTGMYYFWAKQPPNDPNGYAEFIGEPSSYDVGSMSWLTINTAGDALWTVTATSAYYGTGVSITTTNAMHPNLIQIGLELSDTIASGSPASAPQADFTDNQWADGNDAFHYQTNHNTSFQFDWPVRAWWKNNDYPSPANHGGDWQTQCEW